jgi:hypothetical protein
MASIRTTLNEYFNVIITERIAASFSAVALSEEFLANVLSMSRSKSLVLNIKSMARFTRAKMRTTSTKNSPLEV